MLSASSNARGYLFAGTFLLVIWCQYSPANCHTLNYGHYRGPFIPVTLTSPAKKLCGDYGVFLNQTRKCYPVGSQGPCSELKAVKIDEKNPELGTCDCPPVSCGGRPTAYWPATNRCYYIYDQGPCPQGKWLVPAKAGHPTCETIPCPDKFNGQNQPAEISQNDKDYFDQTYYVFSYENICYTTRNENDSPCAEGLSAMFNKASLPHVCVGPFGCGSVSNAGGTIRCPSGKLPDTRGGCEPQTEF